MFVFGAVKEWLTMLNSVTLRFVISTILTTLGLFVSSYLYKLATHLTGSGILNKHLASCILFMVLYRSVAIRRGSCILLLVTRRHVQVVMGCLLPSDTAFSVHFASI